MTKIKNNKKRIQHKTKNQGNLFSLLILFENKLYIIMNNKEDKNNKNKDLKMKIRKRNKEKDKDNFKPYKLMIFSTNKDFWR